MPPALNRRHALGGASARSLLLTVLGEFVLPADGPVWTRSILHTLGLLGVEEKAARQALARTARDGWCDSEQVGRQVRWSLTPAGRRLLTEGAARIYSFGTGPARWDGQWLVLLVSVPEARRSVRHRLRTRLSWAGFGSPDPGVWVSPHTAHEAEADAVLRELGLHAGAMSFTARFAGIGQERAMVDRAWDLDALGLRYQQFCDTFGSIRPAAGDPLGGVVEQVETGIEERRRDRHLVDHDVRLDQVIGQRKVVARLRRDALLQAISGPMPMSRSSGSPKIRRKKL